MLFILQRELIGGFLFWIMTFIINISIIVIVIKTKYKKKVKRFLSSFPNTSGYAAKKAMVFVIPPIVENCCLPLGIPSNP